MSDDGRLPDLVPAAEALREHGEDELAESVSAYAEKRNNTLRRFTNGLKSLLGWIVVVGGAAVATGGFVSLVASGKWIAAAATLVIVALLYAFLLVLAVYRDAFEAALQEAVMSRD